MVPVQTDALPVRRQTPQIPRPINPDPPLRRAGRHRITTPRTLVHRLARQYLASARFGRHGDPTDDVEGGLGEKDEFLPYDNAGVEPRLVFPVGGGGCGGGSGYMTRMMPKMREIENLSYSTMEQDPTTTSIQMVVVALVPTPVNISFFTIPFPNSQCIL